METRESAINSNSQKKKGLLRSTEVTFFIINDIAIVFINMSPYITGTLL